jgi:hypothetical protein
MSRRAGKCLTREDLDDGGRTTASLGCRLQPAEPLPET